MATFGLKIAGGYGKPGLLSEVFKGAFGDPELKAKLALMSSQIWGQEHQNQLYDASTEEKRQLAAKAQQELAILKAQQAARDAASGPLGDKMVADEPMPIPVAPTTRPSNNGDFLDPQLLATMPAVVRPEDQKRYDAAVAWDRAQGPLIVQTAKDAGDLTTGVGRARGNQIVSADINQPGIVTPDQLRLGAMQATGNLPTKDTVLASTDNIGVDAAAREAVQTEAGKAAIDANKPAIVDLGGAGKGVISPADAAAGKPMTAIPNSFPGLTKENAPAVLARLAAKAAANGGKLTDPVDIALRETAQQYVTNDVGIKLGEKDKLLIPSGTPGEAPKQVAGPDPTPASPFPATGSDSDNKNVVYGTLANLRKGQPLTPDVLNAYAIGYNGLYGQKWQSQKGSDGVDRWVQIDVQPPTGVPSPAELASLLGKTNAPAAVTPIPAAAQAIIGPASTPAPVDILDPARQAILHQPGDPVLGDTPPPPTVEQARDQAFATMMQAPAIALNQFDDKHLPSIMQTAQIVKDAATNADPSLFSAAMDLASRDALLDPASRAYEQAVAGWTSNQLYKLSGAAITYPEWVRQQLGSVPLYGDGPDQILTKARVRSNFLRVTAHSGWSNDPKNLKDFIDNSRKQGLELDYPLGSVPPISVPAAGQPAVAPTTPTTPGATPPAAVATPPEEKPSLSRPEGFESLSDEQWGAVFKTLTEKTKAILRAHDNGAQ